MFKSTECESEKADCEWKAEKRCEKQESPITGPWFGWRGLLTRAAVPRLALILHVLSAIWAHPHED